MVWAAQRCERLQRAFLAAQPATLLAPLLKAERRSTCICN